MPELSWYKVLHVVRNPPTVGDKEKNLTVTKALDPLDAVYRARKHTENDTADEWIRAVEVRDNEDDETIIETDHPDADVPRPEW